MKESQVTCAKEKSFAVMQAPKGERDRREQKKTRRESERAARRPEQAKRKRSHSSSVTSLMQEVVQDRTYSLEKKVWTTNVGV